MSAAARRAWPWLALAALVILGAHAALIDYFFGATLPLPEQPFGRGDLATHATQVRRVIAGLEGFGQAWVYDVQLLAGAPNGVLFDADVKGWELWTFALTRLGVGEGRAFNAFVVLVHALVPLVIYASARLFGLERGAALTSAGLAVGLWFFDSFTHWMWFVGTITYALVAYFALLPLALFHRWLERRRALDAIACALSLALGHLLHPYIFFILVAPMLAMYLRAGWVRRALGPRDHLITAAIAALTLVANGWWLATALRSLHYLLDSAYYERGGVEFLVFDLLGLLHDSSTQGMIGPRTALRLALLIAALLGLRRWRSVGDPRRLPFLVLIVAMAALAYLGAYTPATQIQPYRHALPLGFALLIPAADWLTRTIGERPWRSLPRAARGPALIVASLAALHLGRDVAYFFAPSMRTTQELDDGRDVLMNTLGHSYTPGYRYDDMESWEELIAWVEGHDDGQGRWLVFDQVLGEYLMARTDAQLLGGFLVRNLAHSDANWFRREGEPPYDARELRRYLETYAVRWIIVPRAELHPWWEQHPELMTRAGFADGMIIYRVNVPTSLASGVGEVRAALNHVEVRGSRPDEALLLRYHWMETLRCQPDCELQRAELEGDRVGFIRVPAPHPADFEIVNSYSW